jgi:hypothetical protein
MIWLAAMAARGDAKQAQARSSFWLDFDGLWMVVVV